MRGFVSSDRWFTFSGSISPGSQSKGILVMYPHPLLPQSCCEEMEEPEKISVVSDPLFSPCPSFSRGNSNSFPISAPTPPQFSSHIVGSGRNSPAPKSSPNDLADRWLIKRTAASFNSTTSGQLDWRLQGPQPFWNEGSYRSLLTVTSLGRWEVASCPCYYF